MIKAFKKLKIWHRKKKKKKYYSLPQPPPTPHCCSCSAKLQPTAPPLPPWIEIDQPQEADSPFVPIYGSFPSQQQALFQPSDAMVGSFPSDQQALFQPSDAIASEIYAPPVQPVTPSYQQYLAPRPVYGVPVMPVASTEKSAGLFGCVVSIGTFLIRCLCPCFRFRNMN
ncbi:uncharacterized protein LOC131256765 [Magnolia sinica]|uniref:uncharacterized protein LOC131256765 n=1 Tax=Magnolia sinica TaxID=86752 RepID=UPI00265B2026|nr:uncharacterized protein LOC131256765 [Magnolia sinica]